MACSWPEMPKLCYTVQVTKSASRCCSRHQDCRGLNCQASRNAEAGSAMLSCEDVEAGSAALTTRRAEACIVMVVITHAESAV